MTEPKVPGHIAYELDSRAETMPDFNIVTFENGDFPEEALTYQDIVRRGRILAHELEKNGIGMGDTFSLLMRNHPEFLYSMYAASILGAIMVPIEPRTKGERLKYVFSDSKSKGVIFTSEFMDVVKPILSERPDVKTIGVAYKDGMNVSVSDDFPSLNEILEGPQAPSPDAPNEDPDMPFEIIYTSGTTGDPKGVVVKGSRMSQFAQLGLFVWQYTEQDRLYTGLSLTHGNAQAVTLVPSLMLSIPSVISSRFTKSRIWDICRKHGCTTFSLLGGMMMGIYSEPPKPDDADNPVRVVLSAGTPAAIWESFEKRFNVLIHEWYGAVEGGFAHKPPEVGPIGSFGKPIEGLMEMKIFDEKDNECPPHQTGELVFRVVGEKPEVTYLGKK